MIRASRRAFLGLFVAGLTAPPAQAARRPSYGGQLRLSLPLPLASFDPHDPTNLACSLLGHALFEPLYAARSSNQVYPALAVELPQKQGTRARIELRPAMRFSSGRPVLARDLISSIRRSQDYSEALESVEDLRESPRSPRIVELSTPLSSRELATELSRLSSAIVPQGFRPDTPEGCGAFSVEKSGSGFWLRHNTLAPRGGSLLEQVQLESSSVEESLRAFEATRSAFSLLGSGLHQARKNSVPVSLARLGYVVLIPSRRFDAVSRPGELHAHLSYVPDPPFSALGLKRARRAPAKWGGAPFSITFDRDNPLFSQIATELKNAWARRPGDIHLLPQNSSDLTRRINQGAFDTRLSWVSSVDLSDEMVSSYLFLLDGKKAPRKGRIPPPEEAARQLRLGIVGRFEPTGALSRDLSHATTEGRLSLENAYLAK